MGDNLQDSLSFDYPVGIKRSLSITQTRLESPWEQVKYMVFGKGKYFNLLYEVLNKCGIICMFISQEIVRYHFGD